MTAEDDGGLDTAPFMGERVEKCEGGLDDINNGSSGATAEFTRS